MTPGDVDWIVDFSRHRYQRPARRRDGTSRTRARGRAGRRAVPGSGARLPHPDACPNRPWATYAARARVRGRDIMSSFQVGYPDVTVFLRFGHSLPVGSSPSAAVGRSPRTRTASWPRSWTGCSRPRTGGRASWTGTTSPTASWKPGSSTTRVSTSRDGFQPSLVDLASTGSGSQLAFGLWLDHDWRLHGWSAGIRAQVSRNPTTAGLAVDPDIFVTGSAVRRRAPSRAALVMRYPPRAGCPTPTSRRYVERKRRPAEPSVDEGTGRRAPWQGSPRETRLHGRPRGLVPRDPHRRPPSKATAERRLHVGTDLLLELLERHRAKATFFCLSPTAREHPQIVRRLADAGHEIGSHGESHDSGVRDDTGAVPGGDTPLDPGAGRLLRPSCAVLPGRLLLDHAALAVGAGGPLPRPGSPSTPRSSRSGTGATESPTTRAVRSGWTRRTDPSLSSPCPPGACSGATYPRRAAPTSGSTRTS